MSVFLDACGRKKTPFTPIWLMRQAGRYQPEYRAIRDKTSFVTMCKTPDLATEVTLLPVTQLGVDAAILFADADYHQRTEVTLEPGALALLYDIVMPGRLARGERLQVRRFANRTRVSDERGLLVYDAAVIQPAALDMDALGRLEGYPCWGSATLVGDLAAWGLDAVALVAETASALSHLPKRDGIGGASVLARNGLTVRVISQRLETIYDAFSALRLRVRDLCLHSTAPLRK